MEFTGTTTMATSKGLMATSEEDLLEQECREEAELYMKDLLTQSKQQAIDELIMDLRT